MKRKQQFIMGEPYKRALTDQWMFDLKADTDVFYGISKFECIQEVFIGHTGKSGLVYIDPRYDYEEAWLEIYEWLELETATPDPELWGDALPDMPE